ncbi:hypothetical protein B0H13DRAFT_2079277, partial [Mycena leptocephala]
MQHSYGDAVTSCETCGYRVQGVTDTFSQYINVWNTNELCQRYPQDENAHHNSRSPVLNNFMLKLRGLIYHSQITANLGHFTSAIVDAQGIMWCHDGIITRRVCTSNGWFVNLQDLLTLHQRGNQRLLTESPTRVLPIFEVALWHGLGRAG